MKAMKKKLNIDQIQSELRGGSAFFPGYKGDDSPTPPSPAPELSHPEKETAIQNQPLPLPVPPGVPPANTLIPKMKRPIRQRQPFDIFEDQYHRLKRISEAEKDFVNGRGMSQMVRDAIDNYFRDHDTPHE
jgi:hypothetical protein